MQIKPAHGPEIKIKVAKCINIRTVIGPNLFGIFIFTGNRDARPQIVDHKANVNATTGNEAVLSCKVKDLGDDKVIVQFLSKDISI